MSRLLDEIEREAKACRTRETGYRLAGEKALASLAGCAATALENALSRVGAFHAAEGEAREREREA